MAAWASHLAQAFAFAFASLSLFLSPTFTHSILATSSAFGESNVCQRKDARRWTRFSRNALAHSLTGTLAAVKRGRGRWLSKYSARGAWCTDRV